MSAPAASHESPIAFAIPLRMKITLHAYDLGAYMLYSPYCIHFRGNRGGARLRRVLTDFYRWEIRARRSLPPPFMAPMRAQQWAWRPFMNLRPHRCNLLSHM